MKIGIKSMTQQENGNILIETHVPLRNKSDVLIDSTLFEFKSTPHEFFSNMSVFIYHHVDGVLIPYDIRDINNKIVRVPQYVNEHYTGYVITEETEWINR